LRGIGRLICIGAAGGGMSAVQAAIVTAVRLTNKAGQQYLAPLLRYPPINLKWSRTATTIAHRE